MMKLRNSCKNRQIFGLSIYPNKASVHKIKEYLQLAKKYNFKRIFTNLIGLTKGELIKFKELCSFGKKLDLQMIADIDETVCSLYKVRPSDTKFFKELGISTLRLDVKFNPKEVAKMTLNKDSISIEINASDFSGLENEIKSLNYDKANLIASHNFFPQEFTGLSIEKFERANIMMKKANLKISAFVTIPFWKNNISAWDEALGSPTLEVHRNMDLIDQFQHMMAFDNIDIIIVSNMFVKEDEMKQINKLSMKKIIFCIEQNANLTKEEKEILAFKGHKLRGDNPDSYMFRSTISRKVFAEKNIEINTRYTQTKGLIGDVVILNNNAGRYKGELHVLHKDIMLNITKNKVGKIHESQIPLLNLSTPNLEFNFLNKEKCYHKKLDINKY